jgi:hypothetical protein
MLRQDGTLFGVTLPGFELRPIGRPHCGQLTYDALAVARSGEAYVADTDGQIYRVTPDLRCEGPVFDPSDFREFMGMSFRATGDGGEGIAFTESDSEVVELGTIDTTTGRRVLGPVVLDHHSALELAGGEDGRLFGLKGGNYAEARSILEFDPSSGAIEFERPFGPGLGLCSLALLRAEDALFGFFASSEETSSHVVRFDLEGQHATELLRSPFVVIGAGESSCAADRLNAAPGAAGH